MLTSLMPPKPDSEPASASFRSAVRSLLAGSVLVCVALLVACDNDRGTGSSSVESGADSASALAYSGATPATALRLAPRRDPLRIGPNRPGRSPLVQTGYLETATRTMPLSMMPLTIPLRMSRSRRGTPRALNS